MPAGVRLWGGEEVRRAGTRAAALQAGGKERAVKKRRQETRKTDKVTGSAAPERGALTPTQHAKLERQSSLWAGRRGSWRTLTLTRRPPPPPHSRAPPPRPSPRARPATDEQKPRGGATSQEGSTRTQALRARRAPHGLRCAASGAPQPCSPGPPNRALAGATPLATTPRDPSSIRWAPTRARVYTQAQRSHGLDPRALAATRVPGNAGGTPVKYPRRTPRTRAPRPKALPPPPPRRSRRRRRK